MFYHKIFFSAEYFRTVCTRQIRMCAHMLHILNLFISNNMLYVLSYLLPLLYNCIVKRSTLKLFLHIYVLVIDISEKKKFFDLI